VTNKQDTRFKYRSPLLEPIGRPGFLRARIYQVLLDDGPQTCFALAQRFRVSERTLSERLRELVRRGFVEVRGVVPEPGPCTLCGCRPLRKNGRPEKLYAALSPLQPKQLPGDNPRTGA
jgi:predicted ArsR family transcriptional regulator